MADALRLEDVRKVFRGRSGDPDVVAVDGVSLSVAEGEVFGFLGRNGAGKTTTIKMLLNMIPRYEGRATLFGTDARSPRARQGVGYLPETPDFPPHLTVRELLEYHGRLAGAARGARAEQAQRLIEVVDLRDARNRRVRGFSKGMRQRLGLAVSLMGSPRLVFLDEPTANLDPVGRHGVKDLLLELRQQGTTVFINSHILSEIEMTCSRVAIMDRGRIAREGAVSELTHTVDYVHIGVTRVTDDLLKGLEEVARDVRVIGGYIVGRISGEEALDPIPAIVERHGAKLRYLAQARETLEDVFLKTVEEGEHPS